MEAAVSKSSFYTASAFALILFGVLLRIVPHPPNFAPIAAIAIFAGATLPRRFAVIVPLAAMIFSDLAIGLHPLIVLTWGCYALIALASSLLLSKITIWRGLAVTLASSIFFFVVTNFAVWLQGSMYPYTFVGLVRCFALALPFFRNTLVSDLLFTAMLFGLYALAVYAGEKLQVSNKHTGALR